jgi:hypothetical protein
VINGSRAIVLRRLSIQGGAQGLQVTRGSEVEVDRCTLEGNQIGALATQQSIVVLSGTSSDPVRVQNNTVAAITGNGGRGVSCDSTSRAFGDLTGINVPKTSRSSAGDAATVRNLSRHPNRRPYVAAGDLRRRPFLSIPRVPIREVRLRPDPT